MFHTYRLQFLLVRLCLLLLLPVVASAQQRLAGARSRSYLTKVFRLTADQTRHLYENNLRAVQPAFFAQPVDSFPTDSMQLALRRPLSRGYYLVAHTEGPELVYWLRTVSNRQLTVLDNQVDLTLVVRDSLGRLLPDARVWLGRGQRPQVVPYDAATHTYRLADKAGRAGLLAVEQGGSTTYYALEQQFPQAHRYSYPWTVQRVLSRVLYGFPLGYFTRAVRSLVGQLRHASYTNTGLVGLLRSPFSADVRGARQARREEKRAAAVHQWTGYLVLSQPRYRPGDTLRLKARVLHRPDGQPYRKPLSLWLDGTGRTKPLAHLLPVRPGTYEYQLPLGDTLGLRLDQTVVLRLVAPQHEDANEEGILSTSFRYEDYELKNTRYTLRAAATPHRRGTPQALFLRGQDANDLNLLDARVRLSVTPQGTVGYFAGRQVFVPDTLWTKALTLDATGETRLNLPATVLPAADLTYQVRAAFLNGDNERREQTLAVPYTLDAGRLILELRQDSVVARYLVGDQAEPHAATLDVLGLQATEAAPPVRGAVQLPIAFPVDARATGYRLRDAQGREATLDLDEDDAGLLLRSDRTPDSVVLAMENPRRLAFWYYLYRGNELVDRGFGSTLQQRRAAPGAEPWYVSVHYFWAGELQAAEYNVPLPQHRLVVEAEQPEVVYPGQQVELRYTVRDGRGQPVPRTDLTAYAYTSKFEKPSTPELPNFEPPVTGRLSRRRFQLGAAFGNDPAAATRQKLDWGGWRRRLGLDSLRFYQFLYPDYGAFYEYQPAPGGITQFSPFVVDSGRVQPTVAVYVDGVPVFVAAVNREEPFALVADSGFHQVAIRTPNRLVTLHNVYLRHLQKLTLSIDPNRPCHELTVEKRGNLSVEEQHNLERFLLLVDKEEEDERVLLRQGNRLQPLGAGRPTVSRQGAGIGSSSNFYYHSYTERRPYHIGGPFRPDSVLLRRTDGLRRRFLLEPRYRYTLEPGLLKLRCLQGNEFGGLGQALDFTQFSLADFAYTEADMQPRPATNYYRAPRPEPLLTTPRHTPAGLGRLIVRLPKPTPNPPENLPTAYYTLLTRPTDPKFVRLERNLPQTIHALPTGRYCLALLLADSSVLAPATEVMIQPNGATYVQLQRTDVLPAVAGAKTLRRRFVRLVQERLPKLPAASKQMREERREIHVVVPASPQPGWLTVRGRVLDRASGEGLPGVTVLLKGTTIGVATSADGSFTLSVPPTGGKLLFSSVGYQMVEQPADGRDLEVSLAADTKQLSEVVVTGYGIQRQRAAVTGSVATLAATALQGKVAGVQINGATGAAGGSVLIRGSSTVVGSLQPLLLVDGLPYAGQIADISPENIADIKVLKGEQAAATFGSRAVNGVVIITTKKGIAGRTPGGLHPAADVLGPDGLPVAERDPRLSLRRRFSDTGWWRPTLVTDEQGQARTTVTVPDDITGWDTFVLASDDHGRLGSTSALLRSFKALLGELATPRFLVRGDQAQVVGKTLNYLPDTAQVTTSFRVGEGPERTQAHRVATAVLDTLTLTAPGSTDTDSVQVSFRLRQPNGYQDGELRTIPVLPAGSLEQVGTFAVLTATDTTVTWPARPELGPVTIRLESDPLPALLEEIRHVQRYAYLCNEQAASKLKTLLLEQRVRDLQHQPFTGTRDVNRLVRRLLEGRHQPEGIWGTWPTSPGSPWATLHVLEALLQAQQQGYKVALNQPQLIKPLLQQLDYAFADAHTRTSLSLTPAGQGLDALYFRSDDDRIRLLQVLHRLGATPDFPTYVRRLEREQTGRQPLDRYLALASLRQQVGMPYQLDTLRRYRVRTELGGVFYADTLRPGTYYRYLLPDRLGATLLAYKLLRTQGKQQAELTRIRTWLLNQRTTAGHWSSTYEAAQILETILPELLVPGSGGLMAHAQLRGSLAQEVTTFPFTATVPAAAGALSLRKEGGLTVYATAYQSYWNPTPEAKATPFRVRTTVAGQEGSRVQLKAGQPTEVVVTVDVPAEARYVLLEVPIPAGCSYGEKERGNYFEVHREYLRHQVGIFMDVLPAGRHTFRVALQPRYRGRYTINPAKAEMMYFPTKFGRSVSKQAVVK